MLAFKYISFHYIKYSFIVLLALVLFFIGFDYIKYAEKLPESANLLLIYIAYKAFFAVDMLLPLSLVFGMVSTQIFLIHSNALVAFYSLGYTRVDILRPFVVVSTLIIVAYIAIHSSSSFSRSNEFADNIRENNEYLSPTTDLFFTHKNQYIYFSKMLPLQNRAEDIRVFSIDNSSLKEVIVASSAVYYEGYWHIKKADIITKPDDMSFASEGIEVVDATELKILKGFRPKMFDQVYEGKVNFTIIDAIDAFMLLKNQNVDTSSIKSALYKIFIYPFYVPSLIVIIFFFVPVSARFLNVSLFSFAAILSSLLIWGILFMMIQLSNNKTISSELGIIAPVVVLFILALLQWRRFRLVN